MRPPLPPGPFLVVGLARSGVAAALALRGSGAEVVGCDAGAIGEEGREALAAAGVAVNERSDGAELLDGVATLVKSPGVPQSAPVVRAARTRGIRVLGELEIGWRLVPNEVIAVTGSNGKTTTTELIGAIHRAAGVPVAVAGNVGTALSALVGTLTEGVVVVCECSSFQLEDTEAFAPDAAVLLNLAPDHLDRHGTFDAYRAAKLRVFEHQAPDAIAVLPPGIDPPGAAARVRVAGVMNMCPSPPGSSPPSSSPPSSSPPSSSPPPSSPPPSSPSPSSPLAGSPADLPAPDMELSDGWLRWRGAPVMPAAEIRLRGAHNLENAMAAAAVSLVRGIDVAAVRAALGSFAGVPHRLEEVATVNGVLYVDDSKATNVASALVALQSFDAGIHLILGGRGKGEDYAPLAEAAAARCRAAYVIGEEAGPLEAVLGAAGLAAVVATTLPTAVDAARAAARPGEVVLLSPACASYDQYRSFEERGDHFRALVAGGGESGERS